MSAEEPARASEPERPRRRRRWLALVLVLAALAGTLLWVTRPPRVAGVVLAQLGRALDLEISAAGVSEYTWRGAPSLTLREVVARQPGSGIAVLRARRIHVELPWRTVRTRGAELVITRVELDRPEVELAALRRWLASRPPTPKRAWALTEGLEIGEGVLRGDDWRIEGIALDLPRLQSDAPLAGEARGRYVAEGVAVEFDLDLALSRPALPADAQVDGSARIETPTWRMPAWLTLTGSLQAGDDGVRISPLRFGAAARYLANDGTVPFRLGLHGPLSVREGVLTLQPATVALRPQAGVAPALAPQLLARGGLEWGGRLRVELDGALAAWPDTWPALPPPLAQSRAPMPFVLRYEGASDLADIAALRVARDATVFDARFRLPAVLDWLDAGIAGSPLPPLDGTLRAPRLEIAGATLEGVQVELHDDASVQ